MLSTLFSLFIPWLLIGVGAWLLFEMFRLSGRVLLRLEALDEQVKTLISRPATVAPAAPAPQAAPPPPARPQLPLGSAAPSFELTDLAGQQHALSQFKGQKLLLIFFNPQCGYCTRMAEALAQVNPEGGEGRPLPLIVSTGSADDNRAMVRKYGLKCRLLIQIQREVASLYQANGTPMGYLINAEGNIASPLTTGAESLLALAAGGEPVPQGDLPLGSPAPGFELPDLVGNRRSLAEFAGRKLLLIFFSPQCGFCTRMADALAAIPVQAGEGQVLPLLVSAGSAEDNNSMVEEHGLRCPLVLQGQTDLAGRYRCPGTPMGYLIDEQGHIASPKTSGAEALLALCRPKAAASEQATLETSATDSAQANQKPCGKGKRHKKPCAKCADTTAEGNGHANQAMADAQPYDLVDLRELESTDAMIGELLDRSENTMRLCIVLGTDGDDDMSGIESAALRRFLRRRTDWLVSYQPADAARFLVLSRDPRDRKALPSLLTQAANFAKALSLHIADGVSKVTAEQMERRLEICTLCDRRAGDYCSACGCDLPTKTGWRTTFCPLGKWPALDLPPAAVAAVSDSSVKEPETQSQELRT